MHKFSLLFFSLFCYLVLSSCNRNPNKLEEESILTGSTTILVDESLFPIIDDEWIVFSSLYPRAHLKMVYKPERTLLSDFLNGRVKTAILSRKLSQQEELFYLNRKIKIRFNRFASDAVAIVIHKNNQDTLMSTQQLKDILLGDKKQSYDIVFDNANSSITRYLLEFCGINKFTNKNVYALKNNAEVIKYVVKHEKALGIVGVNWLKQPTPALSEMVTNVNIVALKSSTNQMFTKPTQTILAEGRYPLVRELYIYNCQGKSGLGLGFASFLVSDRGQRIVLKSGLLPDKIPPREIHVRKY